MIIIFNIYNVIIIHFIIIALILIDRIDIVMTLLIKKGRLG
jgi:hypothetical protein